MPAHESVACPKCGQQFECKMGSILLCHCNDVKLSKTQQAYIADNWEGCLCHACLLAVSAMTFSDQPTK